MKIAVLLCGISYQNDMYVERDWKLSSQNITENVINCWNSNSVYTFLTTYNNNDNTELLDFYKPKKYNILEFEGSDQRLTYIKGLELLLDEDVDFIISTRFDIHFKQKICDLDIKFDKFNFLFREIGYRRHISYITDTIFMFPKKYLKDLINIIRIKYEKKSNEPYLHNMYNRLLYLGEENLNVISHINVHVLNNQFFKLTRIRK